MVSAKLLAVTAAAVLVIRSTAPAEPIPPTPTPMPNRVVTGVVYDASIGRDAPLADVEVQFFAGRCCGPGGSLGDGTARTDSAGRYRIEVPQAAAFFTLRVLIDGFLIFLSNYSTADVPLTAVIDIPLQPVVVSSATVSGVVSDASIGPTAVIAGATVTYDSYSTYVGGTSGSLTTGSDGRYHFTVPIAQGGASIDIHVEAPGFANGYRNVVTQDPQEQADIALDPSGGIIDVQPPQLSLNCHGQFEITVSNLAPPGETLVISELNFNHDYGEGWYGRGFSWDTSQIALPLFLDGGEHVTIPMTYGADSYPSRLQFAVVGGARSGVGAGDYLGRIDDCFPSPTPTVTPGGTCAGDCDGNGTVTIAELVLGARIALGVAALDSTGCLAMDADGDHAVTIADLVAAVGRALHGCTP